MNEELAAVIVLVVILGATVVFELITILVLSAILYHKNKLTKVLLQNIQQLEKENKDIKTAKHLKVD